jgi:hypothetical protein
MKALLQRRKWSSSMSEVMGCKVTWEWN